MQRLALCWILVCALLLPSLFAQADTTAPRVRIQTNQGDMIVELDAVKAPRTVENFLGYVRAGTYDGTIFHRMINDFVIQGGAYTPNYEARPMRATVQTESSNGLKNERGTIAMARDYDPNSATNQFFINLADNKFLNFHAPKAGYWGYTVFGRVTEGMDVLDRLHAIQTGPGGPFDKDVPKTQIIINKISIEPPAPVVQVASADKAGKTSKADEAKAKKVAKKSTKKSTKKPAAKTDAAQKTADANTSISAATDSKDAQASAKK